MREIKFRAIAKCKHTYITHNKDYGINDGDIVTGFYCQDIVDTEDSYGSIICIDYIRMEYGDNYANVEVDGDTVGQFTGMFDVNGKEIYEGDVVIDHVGTGVVEYSEKNAAFKVNYRDGYGKWFIDYTLRGERKSIEVIGNIHKNKELLGE